MRVLIIDDSGAMRKILSGIMSGLHFDTIEAEDGQDAYEQLEQMDVPELALVDWNMPRMSGIEFVEKVRQDSKYDEMRMMMVTVEAELDNIVRAIEAGADEYVMKPFTQEVIVEKLGILGLAE